MIFEKIKSHVVSHLSYLIGSEAEAVVVDPQRDCRVYVDIAQREGLQIKHIFETHRNEDYVTGSLCPREFVEMSKPWGNHNDVLTTREHLYRLLPLIRMMYSESNPVPLKAALNMVGAEVGKPRRPLLELGDGNLKALRLTMERLGILDDDSYQRRFFSNK